MSETTQKRDAAFRTFPLRPEHGAALQQLIESAADYMQLVFGRPPAPSDGNALFNTGPEEGVEPGDKMLLGISVEGDQQLIGVLDGFRNYPEPEIWYIGLLLFSPNARTRGLGSAVVEAFAAAARASGAHELQLNVVEQNETAHRFWRARGFREVRRWRNRLGERESTFIRMRRPLQPRP